MKTIREIINDFCDGTVHSNPEQWTFTHSARPDEVIGALEDRESDRDTESLDRIPTPPPTEPGWYWVKLHSHHSPEPVFMGRYGAQLMICVVAENELRQVDKIQQWFGPVTPIRERTP